MQSVKKQLQDLKIRPSKRLGQNFLISEKVLNQIIKASELELKNIVVEVGPGLGVLTFELAKHCQQVIAIEKDQRMAEALQNTLRERNVDNVEIINEDILKIQNSNFQFQNFKLISNLPYNIATAVIMQFLEAKNPPYIIVAMVQKEVAERIIAQPPKMNKLAVFCQFLGKPEIISIVPKTAFYPQPKINSAILKITPNPFCNNLASGVRNSAKLSGVPDSARFYAEFCKVVNAGFSHPRKQLAGNFISKLGIPREKTEQWLKKNNINPAQRAETLSVEEWVKLSNNFPLKMLHNARYI